MEGPRNIFLYGMWDPCAVCILASSLRNGMPCTCDPRQVPAGGSYNWAVFLVFEDGQEWVFRSSKKSRTIAPALAGSLISSEVATLKLLKMHTTIPVRLCMRPAENPAGVAYILMDKAPGRPLNKVWSNGEARDKVLRQLGQYTWELAQHRFEQIGSVVSLAGSSFELGECLSRGHILHGRHRPGIINGPFITATQYWRSLFAAFREQVQYLSLHDAHCFMAPKVRSLDYDSDALYLGAHQLREDFLATAQKCDSAGNRVDYVIASAIAQELLREWTHTNPAMTLSKPFALQHPDLSVNNIFVDDAFNITCIIDWEFCTTVPLEMLFSPPGFPQSRHQLSEQLIRKFQQGLRDAVSDAALRGMGGEPGLLSSLMMANVSFTSPSTPEAKDEVAIFSNSDRLLDAGRFFWPLIRLVNFDSTDDHMLLAALWERTPRSDGLSLAARFSQFRASPQYRALWSHLHRTGLTAQRIQRLEETHFFFRRENREVDISIARKLTVASDWETQYARDGAGLRDEGKLFVADAKLWKWVLKWKEEYRDLYG